MILSALFFVRHQGGSEAKDDFFTFARKYMDGQDKADFVYRSELTSLQMLDATAREQLATRSLGMVKNIVSRLYHALHKVEPSRLFSHDAAGFRDDLGHMQLRSLLLEVLERTDD